MFKIQDNEDGSTSIYCKNSGNLLCTIPAKRNSNVPRRVNVVEPQPATVAGSSLESSWHLSKKESTELANSELIRPKDEPCDEPITSFRESKCCISPIPISPDGDQSEDYFDDCITQDAFAKCLNLVSRERLQTQERTALLAEYPLRLLSRSKAYRTLEDLRDLKLPDYMPLTSYLGMKILELNQSRNFISEQKVQISVKNYNSYCRIPFNAPKPSSCHFPKLRCREKKMYPIATTAKTLKHDANHFYTYGRRQRQERMRVMATGLNKRSRKLLELCKTCVVKLKRLTRAEIQSWKKKTPISPSGAIYSPMNRWHSAASSSMLQNKTSFSVPGTSILKSNLQPSTLYAVENQVSSNSAPQKRSQSALPGTSFLKPDSQLPFLLRTPLSCENWCAVTPSTSKFQRKSFSTLPGTSIWRPKTHLAPMVLSPPLRHNAREQQNKCNRKCVVLLTNVIRYIHKRNDHYCVKGTRIRVPFYADFLSTLDVKQLQSAESNLGRNLGANSDIRNDHAYCSSLSKQYPTVVNRSVESNQAGKTQKAPLKPCNVELDSCSKNAQYLNSSPVEDERKSIPLIDLTVETPPPKADNSMAASKKVTAPKWKFRCFACGFHHFYSTPDSEAVADAAIREHMLAYHSVVEPDCFLTKYLDRVNKCTIVEAFPGYKGASLSE